MTDADHSIGSQPGACARCLTWYNITGIVTAVACSAASQFIDLDAPPMAFECRCGFASHVGTTIEQVRAHVNAHAECCGVDTDAHRIEMHGWNLRRMRML